MKLFLRLFAVLYMISPVFAAVPLVTDTVFSVAPGRYEVDAGYGTTNTQTVLTNALGLVLRTGILTKLELAAAFPYTVSDPSGLNDIYLHAKFRFWEDRDHEGFAVRTDFKFNNGDIYRGLGSGDNDYRLLLIYSKKFGKTQLHLNAGYVNTGVNAGRVDDDYFSYSLAVERPAFDNRTIFFSEFVANNSMIPSPTFVLLGMRNDLILGSKLDMGYAFGLNERSIKNSLTAEIHCEF